MGGPPRTSKSECDCPRAKHRHGTRQMYDAHHCGCFPCRMANSQARSKNQAGVRNDDGYRVSNVGTQRRLRALNAAGHTWKSLGDRLGMNMQPVREMAGVAKTHPYTKCYADTAEKVRRLYEELWDVRPEGVAAHRARLAAKRKGYLPPMAWDEDTIEDPTAQPEVAEGNVIDYVAVKRAVDGRDVDLTPTELDAAIAALLQRGMTQTMITKRFGVGKGRVKRVQRQREEAA